MIPGVSREPYSTEWQGFRHRLERYVRRRVSNPADAEDLVQEILTRAVDRLPSLRSAERLTPWLDAISRHALVDYYRRRSRSPGTVTLDEIVDPALPVEPESEGNRRALASCLRPMVSALPAIYREAITRVDLNGERQTDVAAELGIGLSALKSRVQRGRSMLQKVFTDCCNVDRDATGRVVEFRRRGENCFVTPNDD